MMKTRHRKTGGSVGDGITVDLQIKSGNVVEMGRRGEKNPFLDFKK